MTNIIPIPIRKFWNSQTIPIPIRTEVGSAKLFLFLVSSLTANNPKTKLVRSLTANHPKTNLVRSLTANQLKIKDQACEKHHCIRKMQPEMELHCIMKLIRINPNRLYFLPFDYYLFMYTLH